MLSKRSVKHVNWTKRMLRIVLNVGSWWRMSDDQDGCEWVNVSSGTGRTWVVPDKEPLNGCVLCVCVVSGMNVDSCMLIHKQLQTRECPSRHDTAFSTVPGSLSACTAFDKLVHSCNGKQDITTVITVSTLNNLHCSLYKLQKALQNILSMVYTQQMLSIKHRK